MPSFYDLLKYAKTGIASPDMTAYDKMRSIAMAGGAKYPLTTITGVPPLTFLSDGRPLDSVSIIGNGQQTGTPSPDNIIMPEFVGERTENLFDGIVTNEILLSDGSTSSNNNWRCSKYIQVSGNSVTLSWESSSGYFQAKIAYYSSDKSVISVEDAGQNNTYQKSFTLPNGTAFIRFAYSVVVSGNPANRESIMLNTGSTAKPYEPYGYKLNITSAWQTVPVYLGQVQTLRRVKKMVFDGTEENDEFVYSGLGYIRISDGLGEKLAPYSDKLIGTDAASADMPTFSIRQYPSDITDAVLIIKAGANFPNLAAFKSWLAENQITVWYVLKYPKTGIVNEPLAKIGDYADELRRTDAGIVIPTVRGSNTLAVGTTLQPSSVSITGHIKPI